MLQNILPPIIDEQTKVLIMGSMPGQKSLERQQYYGNERNHFWPIIGALLKQPVPSSYEERIALLREHQIGVWDVIHSCERKGSLDATIRNATPNDFAAMFARFPNIEAVAFNGRKAHDVFQKKVGLEVLQGRPFYQLPSTSPIPGKNIKTFEQKIDDWAFLLKYIK